MNYIEIDFDRVKGYNKLSTNAKKFFQQMYIKHNSAHGLEYKKNWIPVSVKEHRQYLEVHFSNNEWLHYYNNGTWG